MKRIVVPKSVEYNEVFWAPTIPNLEEIYVRTIWTFQRNITMLGILVICFCSSHLVVYELYGVIKIMD